MARPEEESRSRLAVGMEWASRVSTVGLEFALPPLLGALLDRRFGVSPWGVLLGALLGFALGMTHLLRFAREGTAGGGGGKGRPGPGP